MGDLRPVYGRNFVGYGRLRHRKRPYAVVYDRRNDRPGNFKFSSNIYVKIMFTKF